MKFLRLICIFTLSSQLIVNSIPAFALETNTSKKETTQESTGKNYIEPKSNNPQEDSNNLAEDKETTSTVGEGAYA